MILGSLALGTANLGNLHTAISDDEATAILETAWDLGIRYFDTAPHYGLGLSERRLGAFLQTKPRDEYVVSTKVGRLIRADPTGKGLDTDGGFVVPADHRRVWDPTATGIRASLMESLERLGLDRVDIVYLHDPEQYGLDESLRLALPALAKLREQAVVQSVGIGSMSTSALVAAARSGLLDLLMVAGRYTLLEQPIVPELTDACDAHNVSMITASIFNSGLLATSVPSTSARYNYGAVPDELLSRAQAIATVCEAFDVELPTAALHYTLRDPRVRSVVIGTSSAAQLRENATRMANAVPPELWTELRVKGLIPIDPW